MDERRDLTRRDVLKLGGGALAIAGVAVAAWEPYVKNFGPNFGHDYGGRLMVAWLDK